MPQPVLARELTDLPEVIRRVPAPPVPVLRNPFSLRVADLSDAELVAEWMNRPHLAAAWEYDWPVARWRRHLQAQLEGSYSVPLIVALRGVEGAYLELYRAAKDSIADRYDAHPRDLGLHAAIADEEYVNRGFATLLLPQFVANVFDIEPDCPRVMFDPDHRNTAVRRLCEYAGCRFLGEHEMANRRMALYAFDRPNSTS
ncbi:MAG: GNAT family N-acetyltransferase [Mycobacterium sp.]|uniref:GNAT family N-acetyltransferase n=1 Tax=Mycobacterium sp. TaxID=1785 RepID=UPI003CC53F4E